MKKQLLLLGVLTLFVGLSSCKKEAKVSTDAASVDKASKLKTNTTPTATYVDMTLVARKPGENYDTYHCIFHGISLYVIGPLIYDQTKYPDLINGVPAFGQSMYADNQGTVDYQNSGPDGNIFGGTQGRIVAVNDAALQADIERYFTAISNWEVNGMDSTTEPLIGSFLKSSYSLPSPDGTTGPIVFTGKVIRVTTGTHIGLADINYPLPVAVASTYPLPPFELRDPLNPHTTYLLQGNSKFYISALVGADYSYPANSAKVTASGTAIHVTIGTGVWNFTGTIIRSDGTSFTFNITQDIS